MLDKDKILISAYLDGEISDLDKTYVEELIKKDSEADDYLNAIKEVYLELSSLSNDPVQHAMDQRTQKFIDDKIKPKLQTKQTSVFSFLENAMFRHVAGYSVTAALFFGFGMNIINNDSQNIYSPTSSNDYSLSGFDNESTKVKEFVKFRNESSDTKKDKVKLTLGEMIDEKVLNSRILWGGDSYFLTIEELAYKNEGITCYEGELLDEGKEVEFLYCVSENDSTLTYLN